MSLPPRPQMTSRPGLPVSVSLRSLPRMVHAGDDATAVVDMEGRGITLHVAAMLAVMAVVALMVYDHVGVSVLKKAWINLDWVWAGASALAGVLTLFT